MHYIHGNFEHQHAVLDSVVLGDERPLAVQALARYFREPPSGRASHGFRGRRFETYGTAHGPVDPDCITDADIVAVSLLSIERGIGAIALDIENSQEAISALLRAIPHTPLHQAPRNALTRESAAWRLHSLLKGMGGENRDVSAVKLLGRKRPHLVPIYDSRIKQPDILGDVNVWDTYWTWFHAPDAALRQRRLASVENLRTEVPDTKHVSLLRCLDVVLWMKASGYWGVQ